jgi:hypothetical protein
LNDPKKEQLPSLVSESGSAVPFTIPRSDAKRCDLINPEMIAYPQPDGTAHVTVSFNREEDYDIDRDRDGAQHPLVMVGTDIYGLSDKPFSDQSYCNRWFGGTHCIFHFIASADSLRAARNFTVRDVAWDAHGSAGTIRFSPAFSALAPMTKPAAPPALPAPAVPPTAPPPAPVPAVPKWYELTGTDLWQLHSYYVSGISACMNDGSCLYAYDDSGVPIPLTGQTFRVVSDTIASVKLPAVTALRLAWQPAGEQPVLWELKPKEEEPKTKPVADIPVLYVADSRAVTFSGPDLSKVTAVTFEGNLLTSTPKKKDLQVQVTTVVTKKPGHKELLAVQPDPKDKTKNITTQLPLDVVVR